MRTSRGTPDTPKYRGSLQLTSDARRKGLTAQRDLRDAAGGAPSRRAGGPGACPSGPPASAARSAWGLVRALRPRQWVKNVLVFAAPLAAGAVFDAEVLRPSRRRLRAVLPRRLGRLPGQRHDRRRGRPPAPAQAVPADRGRHRAAVAGRWRWPSCCSPSRWPRRCCSPGRSWPACWPATSSSSSPTAWCSRTSRSSTSPSSPPGSCCAASPAASPPGCCCRSGSCSSPPSARCSWSPASATPSWCLVGDDAAPARRCKEYSASYLRFVWSLSAGVAVTAYSLWAFEMGETQDGRAVVDALHRPVRAGDPPVRRGRRQGRGRCARGDRAARPRAARPRPGSGWSPWRWGSSVSDGPARGALTGWGRTAPDPGRRSRRSTARTTRGPSSPARRRAASSPAAWRAATATPPRTPAGAVLDMTAADRVLARRPGHRARSRSRPASRWTG